MTNTVQHLYDLISSEEELAVSALGQLNAAKDVSTDDQNDYEMLSDAGAWATLIGAAAEKYLSLYPNAEVFAKHLTSRIGASISVAELVSIYNDESADWVDRSAALLNMSSALLSTIPLPQARALSIALAGSALALSFGEDAVAIIADSADWLNDLLSEPEISDDKLSGTGGADTLSGGQGRDVLIGNGGEDILRGGEGTDYLYGGYGDDQLYGEAGIDYIYGGYGSDTYHYNTGDGKDYISDVDGSDKIVINGNQITDVTQIEEGSNHYIDDFGNTYFLTDFGDLIISVFDETESGTITLDQFNQVTNNYGITLEGPESTELPILPTGLYEVGIGYFDDPNEDPDPFVYNNYHQRETYQSVLNE